MVEPSRITEKATELAGQAAQAAGPAVEKAKEVAGELVEKAAGIAAQGISAAAEQIDKVTGGKYADRISSVSSKIEDALERDK
jgi:hypothetical protein